MPNAPTWQKLVAAIVAAITASLSARFGPSVMDFMSGPWGDIVTLSVTLAITVVASRLMPEGSNKEDMKSTLEQVATAAAIKAVTSITKAGGAKVDEGEDPNG